MTYDVTITDKRKGTLDLKVENVSEDCVANVVTSSLGPNTVVVIEPSRTEGDKKDEE